MKTLARIFVGALLVALALVAGALKPALAVPLGAGCLALGFAFGWLAWRVSGRSSNSGSVPSSAAMDQMEKNPGGDVMLHGVVEGDPPLVGPISGAPCLSYRIELFRPGPKGEELVALEEQACDRLVLSDASGRVALSAEPRTLASVGAPVAHTALTGWLGTPDEDPRLARATRHLATDEELEAAEYRVVERAVRHGASLTAVGRMVRRAGEPVLVPSEKPSASLRFEVQAAPASRRIALACATLAVLSLVAGISLIVAGPERAIGAQRP
jgi:hypothetical protein